MPLFNPFTASVGVNGSPLCSVVMVLTCQPPITLSILLPTPEAKRLPLPNGSSYRPLNTNRLGMSNVDSARAARILLMS